ncbi:hypothetical protein Y032_0055g2585 [Ancylostoma ceylanicum]|uniref:Serpentine receptor class gamma n=2 Tax=Ancylostoma ceylanicum TaxID=53326 RepID=A0A016U7D2_9BILA|nr:hypothetical protein Y032_0055g2585 [Ancylostoma ceylanicum]
MTKSGKKVDHFKTLIIFQSLVYYCTTTLTMLLNNVYTAKVDTPTRKALVPLSRNAFLTLQGTVTTCATIRIAVIISFNIHRMLLIIRPNKLQLFYMIMVPITICGSAVRVYANFVSGINLLSFAVEECLLSLEIVSTLTCFYLTRQYFKKHGCSERVKKMQDKMSKGLLLQLLIEVILNVGNSLAFLGEYLLYKRIFDLVNGKAIVIFNMVVFMTLMWQPVIMGVLIRWIVSGLFTSEQERRTTN